jgi:hypothetical protein
MRVVNAVVFTGLTAWAAVAHWQLVPGLACMALGQTCLLLVMVEGSRVRVRMELGWSFLGLSYVGLAWLFAALFGAPTSGRFWIVFAAIAVVFSPVVLLARCLFLRP